MNGYINKSSYPFNVNPKFTAQCAEKDIDGVRKADVFVLLSNSEPSMGASAELGAAVASFLTFKRPYVFVIGPHFDTNFCFYHPVVIQKGSIDEVLQAMVTLELFLRRQNTRKFTAGMNGRIPT